MAWWDGITNLKDMSLSKLWEIVKDREDWHPAVHGSQRVGHNFVNEEQKKIEKYELSVQLKLENHRVNIKREGTNKIRNEKVNIATDTTEQ